MGITRETQQGVLSLLLLLCYSYIIIQILLPSSMSYNYNHIFGDIILCDTCFFIIQEKKNVKSGKKKRKSKQSIKSLEHTMMLIIVSCSKNVHLVILCWRYVGVCFMMNCFIFHCASCCPHVI